MSTPWLLEEEGRRRKKKKKHSLHYALLQLALEMETFDRCMHGFRRRETEHAQMTQMQTQRDRSIVRSIDLLEKPVRRSMSTPATWAPSSPGIEAEGFCCKDVARSLPWRPRKEESARKSCLPKSSSQLRGSFGCDSMEP
jgi:hypothetical protein